MIRYVGVAANRRASCHRAALAQLPAMHAEDNGLAFDFTVTTPRQTPDPAIPAVRRAQLELLVAGTDAITFSEAIAAEGAIVFAKACELGLEGIVSKRLGGVYSSGPCRNWVKVRNPAYERQ